MHYSYKTQGVCSREISFDLEDGCIHNLSFLGGCDGNLKGIARLAEGKKAEEVVQELSGINCGFKKTSCPDQLATALKKVLKQN